MRFLQAFSVVVLCAAVLLAPTAVSAWGPTIHNALAAKMYQDPGILALAAEFGTDVATVTSGADELDYAGDPDHANYHGGQWDMTQYRQYVYDSGSASNKWYAINQTTRLKYMLHNLGDNSVPIGHSPANQNPDAPSGTLKEAFFEAQADVSSYGSPATPSSWYSGTIFGIVTTFHSECMANTAAFVPVTAGLLTVSPWSTANACANEGWRISQMLGKAVLTDYYLAQRNPADAGPDKVVTMGGPSATFDATALRDSDNITWNTDGSYYYRPDWTGISQVQWDFNNDGTYDATGLTASKSYWALKALYGASDSGTCRIDVLDDEGLHWTDTANITLVAIPEPGTGLLAILAAVSALLFARFRRRAS